MSMLNRPADSTEVGEVVAAAPDYAAAQKTVSALIAGEVPARDIAIVGQGVPTIERVTGRLGYATAARSGAINGILIGLFLSAVLVLGNPDAPIQLFVGFLFIGIALGMILSLVSFAIVRRRRDFASVTQIAADRYEVTVMHASLAKARTVLGHVKAAPKPEVDLSEPPRYGERVPAGVDPASVARRPGASAAAQPEAQAAHLPPAPPAPASAAPAPPAPAVSAAEAAAATPTTTPGAPDGAAADASAASAPAAPASAEPSSEAGADAPAADADDADDADDAGRSA